MFLFDNVLTAGTVLVRQQIESQNYTPSAGANGWAILADGSAFFNNVNVRGVFQTGVAPDPRVIIDTAASVGLVPAYGRESFYTGAVGEVTPATLAARADQFGRTNVALYSNDMGYGQVGMRMDTASSVSSPGLITLKNLLTNGQELDFDIEGQFSASGWPLGVAFDGTTRSTASLTYVGIAGDATPFTMPIPRSGRVLLLFWALTNNATAGANTNMSAEIRNGSLAGAILTASTDAGCVRNNNTGNASGFGFMYADLSAFVGSVSTLYVRNVYRVSAGTGNFVQHYLMGFGLP